MRIQCFLLIFIYCIHFHALFAYESAPRCSIHDIKKALPYAYLVEHNNDRTLTPFTNLGDYQLWDLNDLPNALTTAFNLINDNDLLNPLCSGISTENQTIECMGLLVRIYINEGKKELVMAFQGSEINYEKHPIQTLLNWMSNTIQAIGYDSISYELANQMTRLIKEHFPSYTLTLIGHSLGAGLAQYAAVMNACEAYCFNSPGLGQASLKMVDKLKAENPEKYSILSHHIHHIHIRGDILQDINALTEMLFDTEKIGQHCAIPPHKALTIKAKTIIKKLMNKCERHQAPHIAQSLTEALDNETDA